MPVVCKDSQGNQIDTSQGACMYLNKQKLGIMDLAVPTQKTVTIHTTMKTLMMKNAIFCLPILKDCLCCGWVETFTADRWTSRAAVLNWVAEPSFHRCHSHVELPSVPLFPGGPGWGGCRSGCKRDTASQSSLTHASWKQSPRAGTPGHGGSGSVRTTCQWIYLQAAIPRWSWPVHLWFKEVLVGPDQEVVVGRGVAPACITFTSSIGWGSTKVALNWDVIKLQMEAFFEPKMVENYWSQLDFQAIGDLFENPSCVLPRATWKESLGCAIKDLLLLPDRVESTQYPVWWLTAWSCSQVFCIYFCSHSDSV